MTLELLMQQLNAAGWNARVSLRTAHGGLWSATVWRDDHLGGGRSCRADTPTDALRRALASAEEARENRRAKGKAA